jgi:primosomal protein DnaI
MKKINAEIQLTDKQISLKQHTIKKLLDNDLVKRFLNDNNLDYKIVERYPFRFKTWLDSLLKCKNCKGLSECKQDSIGEYFDLKFDGVLDIQIEKCAYALAEYSKNKHLKYFKYSDLPNILSSTSLMSAISDAYTTEYKDGYNSVLKWYLKKDYSKGLYIYGDVGVGKSYLAACVANEFAKDKKNVSYIHVPTFVNKIRNLMINDNNEYKYVIKQLKTSYFVVFDDIGAEALTSFNRDEILMPILDYRMNNKLLTIFTSNEDFESLHDHFENDNKTVNKVETLKADRIMDRIKSLTNLLNLEGLNRRNH